MRAKQFPWRFVFYGGVVLYLACDLWWFGGPIRQKYDHRQSVLETRNAFEDGDWVATVNREPITSTQLDRATQVALYREGKTRADVSDAAYRIKRRSTLQDLVNDTLIRQYAAGDRWKAEPEAIERRKSSFRSQFPPATDLSAIDQAQGLTAAQRETLLEQLAHQEAWIEQKIAPRLEVVTEEKVRSFYDADESDSFVNPARVRAKHLFLSTVEKDHEARAPEIAAIRERWIAGEPFDQLVVKFSEDERTKPRGGDLGWIGERGIPAGLEEGLRTLPIGQKSEPVRTELGWHLIEVMERAPAEKLPYEAVREEIRAMLLSQARADAVQELIIRYRSVAILRVYPPNL